MYSIPVYSCLNHYTVTCLICRTYHPFIYLNTSIYLSIYCLVLQANQTLRNSSLSPFHEEESQPFVCAFYNPDFIIYSSIGSFYIPCCIMVILYFRIFKVGVPAKTFLTLIHTTYSYFGDLMNTVSGSPVSHK